MEINKFDFSKFDGNIFIDCDGVIFDTEALLFDDNYYKAKLEPNFNKTIYVQNKDWYNMILESKEINESIRILKELKNKVIILTKINSLDNEGVSKIKILRDKGVTSDVILVPFNLKKTDVVSAKGNILIDDTIHNLDDWYNNDGFPIFFNKDNADIDSWYKVNTKYKKVKSLEFLLR